MNQQQMSERAQEVINSIVDVSRAMQLSTMLGLSSDSMDELALLAMEKEFELAELLRGGADVPHPLNPAGVEGFLERHPENMTARELLDQRKAAAGIR